VIKLIISFFFIFIFSCEPISKDIVKNKIENTKKIVENKKNKINIKTDKHNSPKDKIFYLIGDPFYIEGVEYTPEENYNYDMVGLATYYDKEFHNKKTLNNDLNKVTELLGRHKTLPLPSIVKITNLENGLSLIIKIVDRHDDNASIIQVSRKVSQLLRFYKNKIAKVRVEILSDPSKQWKSVIMSINDNDFSKTVVSAPTEIVSISNIDNNYDVLLDTEVLEQPIELGLEKIQDVDLFLHVNNFKNYQEIQNIINQIKLNEKYTTENIENFYKLVIGPIDNQSANKLVSTFISKGYKDTELILE
jgi:rare lipoprotein A